MDELFQHGTVYAAMGLHRTDVYEVVTTSLFTLSVTLTRVGDPQVAAARALLSRVRWAHWSADAGELRSVAGATPAAYTAGLLRCGGEDAAPVCQAAYTFLVPGTTCLTTAMLTSPDLSQASDYAEILQAIADTITFDAPNRAASQCQPTSRLSELLT